MGVDEFRRELATIKSSFELELIPDKEIYEKMCLDAQRRNLPNMASVSADIQPLNSVGLKRLLWRNGGQSNGLGNRCSIRLPAQLWLEDEIDSEPGRHSHLPASSVD